MNERKDLCSAVGSKANGGYKLRIIPKKLRSGRCQVKFFAGLPGERSLYGYALVEPDETLKGVVENINQTLHGVCAHSDFRHQHLYAVQKNSITKNNIIIFET